MFWYWRCKQLQETPAARKWKFHHHPCQYFHFQASFMGIVIFCFSKASHWADFQIIFIILNWASTGWYMHCELLSNTFGNSHPPVGRDYNGNTFQAPLHNSKILDNWKKMDISIKNSFPTCWNICRAGCWKMPTYYLAESNLSYFIEKGK